MKKSIYLLTLAGLFTLNACKFNEDINTDPNNPRDVTGPSTLLTSAQVGFGYTYGGAYARYTSMFVQQLSGIDRQALSIDNYNFLTSETDNAWDNSYQVLRNLNEMIDHASGSPHYTGVAKIMKALVLGSLAENFGSVPYRTALMASENGTGYQSAFDPGPTNYEDIHTLLTEGIAEITAAESILDPGEDDILFSGDLSSWERFAHGLNARYYLHEAKTDGSKYAMALAEAELAKGIAASVNFAGASVGSQSPLYQYETQRGDLGSGRALTDSLKKYNDPRAPIYVTDPAGDGSNPGTGDGGNSAGDDYVYPNVLPNDPVYFMNVGEPYFIAAEIKIYQGDLAGAAADYNQAVINSLAERGIQSTDTILIPNDTPDDSASKLALRDYFDATVFEDATTITLTKVMTQKWLGMYLSPELFADYRRTGIPNLNLPAQNILGSNPLRKFPYPQKERNLNAANVPSEPNPPQAGRVWWDVP